MPRPRTATATLEAAGAFEAHPERKRDNEPPAPAGDPVKPKLKGRASRIWDEYAPICINMQTLCRGDELEFATWCNLQAEWEKDGERFATSRLAQKRAYAERFGIAGAGSRGKIAVPKREKEDPAEEYFKAKPVTGPGNSLRQ